jgi:hypothetical protein
MKDTGPDIIEDVTMITPREAYDWVPMAAIALGVTLVVVFILWRLFRAKKLPFQHPPVPPEIAARERLAKIRHLIAEGKHEQFVIEVSSILRDYIEGRFGLKAPTLSSEEFLYEAEQSALLDAQWRETLSTFLTQCDRVKFALAHLQPPRMEELYTTAETFINSTTTPGGSSARSALPAHA